MNSTLIFHHDTQYRHQVYIKSVNRYLSTINKNNIQLQYNMYYNFVQNLEITIKYIKHHVVHIQINKSKSL